MYSSCFVTPVLTWASYLLARESHRRSINEMKKYQTKDYWGTTAPLGLWLQKDVINRWSRGPGTCPVLLVLTFSPFRQLSCLQPFCSGGGRSQCVDVSGVPNQCTTQYPYIVDLVKVFRNCVTELSDAVGFLQKYYKVPPVVLCNIFRSQIGLRSSCTFGCRR